MSKPPPTGSPQLRAEGEAAVAAAASTAELEEVRVRFLGRKAELPNLLRDVGKLPPEERGPVGKGANQARQALQAAVDSRQAELEALELEATARGRRRRRHAPRHAGRCPPGTCTSSPPPGARSRTCSSGLGFRVVEGPEIDLAYYNFDALNHDVDHPARSEADTFYVADDVVLRTQTSPMQVRADGAAGAAAVHHRPGPGLPARQRRDAHAAVPPGRGPGGRRGPDARRPAGHAAGVRPRDLRRRPRGPPAPALLPLHRAVGGARRVAASTASRASCGTARAARCARARPGSRSSAPAWWTRTSTATCAESGYDPEKHQGFAWGMGIERIAFLKHGVPDLRMFFENDLRLLEQFG